MGKYYLKNNMQMQTQFTLTQMYRSFTTCNIKDK